MKIKICLISFLSLLILSCTDDDFPVTLDMNQTVRLLTADSSKVWVLEASPTLSECAWDDQYKFTLSKKKEELNSFKITKGSDLCDNMEKEIIGYWKVDTLGETNMITLYALDTTSYKIDFITASKLNLKGQDQKIQYFMAKPY